MTNAISFYREEHAPLVESYSSISFLRAREAFEIIRFDFFENPADGEKIAK